MATTYTIEVVPFEDYDWTFKKPGWLNLKYVNKIFLAVCFIWNTHLVM